MTMNDRFRDSQVRSNSLLCVGLDPQPDRFPLAIGRLGSDIRRFNQAIIEATSDIACCYKPNLGFYLPHGMDGIEALANFREDVPAEIPILLDAKIGDIDTTTKAYARAYFEEWKFDAVTAHPYMGQDSLQPLIDYGEQGIFVLAKTSNPGSGMIQDRQVESDSGESAPVSVHVARHATSWNRHGNIGLVAGATFPRELSAIRSAAPDLPILIPGVGAQEGDLEDAVRAGLDSMGYGILVNSSRGITYASDGVDFQSAARASAIELRDRINQVRETVPV